MDTVPTPLSMEQSHALLRFLGLRAGSKVVMASPGAHYVAVPGQAAIKLTETHTLPGARTVRYGRHGETIFVADAVRRNMA